MHSLAAAAAAVNVKRRIQTRTGFFMFAGLHVSTTVRHSLAVHIFYGYLVEAIVSAKFIIQRLSATPVPAQHDV